MGATDVIDRKLPLSELPDAVRAITAEPIKFIYDSISSPDSQNALYDVLAPGGQLLIVTVKSVDEKKLTEDKPVTHVFGSAHVPPNREFCVSLYSKLTELLASGDIKVCLLYGCHIYQVLMLCVA